MTTRLPAHSSARHNRQKHLEFENGSLFLNIHLTTTRGNHPSVPPINPALNMQSQTPTPTHASHISSPIRQRHPLYLFVVKSVSRLSQVQDPTTVSNCPRLHAQIHGMGLLTTRPLAAHAGLPLGRLVLRRRVAAGALSDGARAAGAGGARDGVLRRGGGAGAVEGGLLPAGAGGLLGWRGVSWSVDRL